MMVYGIFAIIILIVIISKYKNVKSRRRREYIRWENEILKELNSFDWNVVSYFDRFVTVKSYPAMKRYDILENLKKESKEELVKVENIIKRKKEVTKILKVFLEKNKYKIIASHCSSILEKIDEVLQCADFYRVRIDYILPTGICLEQRIVEVYQYDIERLILEAEVLEELGVSNWDFVSYYDEYITVKSRQAFEKYDDIKFFKGDKEKLVKAEEVLKYKNKMANVLRNFLNNNKYKEYPYYDRLTEQINDVLKKTRAYRIKVSYISSAGNNLGEKNVELKEYDIYSLRNNTTLFMGKAEYNKYLKEQEREALNLKHHEYYDCVNKIIDYANKNKDSLVIKGSQKQLDSVIAQLFDRTVNSIKKIKTIDSEEWGIIRDFIIRIEQDVKNIVSKNQRILDYYKSSDFLKIKETCETLMSTQREFNEYIIEKIESVSKLFGTRIIRNETVNDDEYNYIRPYKKTITPFTAEVSAAVFASAENNPLEYVVKQFYPNKTMYPEQIRKLYLLVEELETLKDAKQIIENYKAEYQQYLGDVPDYIMNDDEIGFYSRLGFANIDESVLAVEYKFAYTSGGGMAQRSFTIPMEEETIVELIKVLENKLTATAFAKEQRTLMTKKLREFIKNRDNFTCCSCGNSAHAEPNLLLEIDHIIPIAKGGCTVKDNLQTLCWKCNRSKSDKLL